MGKNLTQRRLRGLTTGKGHAQKNSVESFCDLADEKTEQLCNVFKSLLG